jgi:hypothetical protein
MSIELELKSHEPNLMSVEQIAQDFEIRALVRDISAIRFGEPIDYELGDADAMKSAMQKAFNFRKEGVERTEREDLPQRELFDNRVLELAQKFGLSGDTSPSIPDADVAVVLGAAAKAVIERTMYTKELLDSGKLQTNTIAFLGSSRPVDQAERDRGGLYATSAKDEYDLLLRAPEQVFEVKFDASEEFQGYDDIVPTGFDAGWRISHAKTEDGKDIFVFSAPMLKEDRLRSNGNRRLRANTPDTYDMLGRVAQLAVGSRLVAVTNSIYKFFQDIDASIELSRYGIETEAVGFDPAHFGNPPRDPEELLQETLSAVKSMYRAEKELAKIQ